MVIAHVNGHCMETCVNIKLSFFLHVLISLKKKIQYCETLYGFDRGGFAAMFANLPICTFMTMNFMMKKLMKITLKNHGLLICAGL
jgi:hypothetical protein